MKIPVPEENKVVLINIFAKSQNVHIGNRNRKLMLYAALMSMFSVNKISNFTQYTFAISNEMNSSCFCTKHAH